MSFNDIRCDGENSLLPVARFTIKILDEQEVAPRVLLRHISEKSFIRLLLFCRCESDSSRTLRLRITGSYVLQCSEESRSSVFMWLSVLHARCEKKL